MDMDAFYAAVEIRDNPGLLGKPVIIGASPEERGVVSTCSYEAREYNVRSGMSIKTAYQNCPQGIYIKPNMGKYKKVSDEIHEILFQFTDRIEFISLDEAYLDVGATVHLFGGYEALADRIQREVWEKVNLTCSIGVGYNMLSAKVASEENKPCGIFIIKNPDVFQKLVLNRSVTIIPGVGKATLKEFERFNIRKVRDFIRLDEKYVKQVFGNRGLEIFYLCQGLSDRVIHQTPKDLSISKEVTYQEDTEDIEQMKKTLVEIIKKLSFKMKEEGKLAKTFTLKLKYSDMQVITRAKSISDAVNDTKTMYGIMESLLEKVNFFLPIRLVGFGASNFVLNFQKRRKLLDDNKDNEKDKKLEKLIHEMKKKYGMDVVKDPIDFY